MKNPFTYFIKDIILDYPIGENASKSICVNLSYIVIKKLFSTGDYKTNTPTTINFYVSTSDLTPSNIATTFYKFLGLDDDVTPSDSKFSNAALETIASFNKTQVPAPYVVKVKHNGYSINGDEVRVSFIPTYPNNNLSYSRSIQLTEEMRSNRFAYISAIADYVGKPISFEVDEQTEELFYHIDKYHKLPSKHSASTGTVFYD